MQTDTTLDTMPIPPPAGDDTVNEIPDTLLSLLQMRNGESDESCGVDGDNEYERRRRAKLRQQRTAAQQLRRGTFANLLDHNKIISRRKHHKRQVTVFGTSLVAGVSGLFGAGMFALLLSATGMAAAPMMALQKAKTLAKPILEEIDILIEAADKAGLDVKELREKLEEQTVHHILPRRMLKYAALTMFGGGAKSFWLSATCMGIAAASAPSFVTASLATVNAGALLAQAVDDTREELLQYRLHHDPTLVDARIRYTVQKYKEYKANKRQRDYGIHDMSEITAQLGDEELWQQIAREYYNDSERAQALGDRLEAEARAGMRWYASQTGSPVERLLFGKAAEMGQKDAQGVRQLMPAGSNSLGGGLVNNQIAGQVRDMLESHTQHSAREAKPSAAVENGHDEIGRAMQQFARMVYEKQFAASN